VVEDNGGVDLLLAVWLGWSEIIDGAGRSVSMITANGYAVDGSGD
jgi:hypothetical protein